MIIHLESLKDTLSKNFKRIVSASDMSVREIASSIGVTESSLHRWKSGTDVPKLENVDALAKLFGVDPAEFYKTEGNVITLTPRGALKKYLVIPDEIVEELSHFEEKDKIWEMIKGAIKIQKEFNAKNKNSDNGKQA